MVVVEAEALSDGEAEVVVVVAKAVMVEEKEKMVAVDVESAGMNALSKPKYMHILACEATCFQIDNMHAIEMRHKNRQYARYLNAQPTNRLTRWNTPRCVRY